MAVSLRKLSGFFFRKRSLLLTEINSNGLLVEWSKSNRTNNIFPNRFELYEFLASEVLGSKPIDYLEFGVWKGASLRKWAELNGNKESRFFGFDTFEGLPEVWDTFNSTWRAGHFDVGGKTPDTGDSRIQFIKGLFQTTLPGFLKSFESKNHLVIHNDSDLYSSTLYCLTQLDGLLRPGSILIFDEFNSSSHEFQAFYDYAKSYQRAYTVLGAVGRDPYEQIALRME